MKQQLVLASGSPRRKQLLEQLHLSFTVHVSSVEEIFDANQSPYDIVMSLALQKANDVAAHYPDAYVLGSDTVVVYDGNILGKPSDENEAVNMLQMLSGSTHEVVTGVAIVHKGKAISFYEKADVTFWELTKEEIMDYVKSGEPMDKAGSYGIQGLGASLVQKMEGDYYSVVGLPLSKTIRELKKAGYVYEMNGS
ncbi:Maf family protein [Priestia abyssalis]|uniref:Maf family protein n=1 Tax=Priestia abyssalis TaxID=1221450 RepID=UPI000995DA6F|nr:Maf family protein [Priestia abyssalis]